MKTSKPRVLVVGGRDSSLDWPGHEDFELFLVQEHPHVSPRQAVLASIVEVGDLSYVESYLPSLKLLNNDVQFSGVVSFFEKGLLPAAKIGELLKIPHNSRASVESTRRKAILRKILTGTPYEVPYAVVRTAKEVYEFYRMHGCCIVKPVDGSGSVDIYKVDSEMCVLPAMTREFIVEKFLNGTEYSVETFTSNGRHQLLGITKKYTTGAPNFVETGHDFPAHLSEQVFEQVRNAVFWLLQLIGHALGPCHTEVKVDGNFVYFIETQTRFGGDQIWEMVWCTTGVHLAAATIFALTEKPYVPSPVEFTSMAIRFPQLPVTADGVSLRQCLKEQPFAVRVELKEANFGKTFSSSSQRHGYVLFGCRSDDQEAFKKAIELGLCLFNHKE